jgi:hypothetical protein
MELGQTEDRTGPLGESGGSWLEKSGNSMWQASTSKVVAPPESVTDRWVGPHEQVFNVPIAY